MIVVSVCTAGVAATVRCDASALVPTAPPTVNITASTPRYSFAVDFITPPIFMVRRFGRSYNCTTAGASSLLHFSCFVRHRYMKRTFTLVLTALAAVALFAGLVHAVLVAAHVSEPAATTVYGLTVRRLWATAGAV